MGESLCMVSALALVLALILTVLALPKFNQIAGKQMTIP